MLFFLFLFSCLEWIFGIAFSIIRSDALWDKIVFLFFNVVFVLLILVSALSVRFLTKRYIGEYDHQTGKLNFFLSSVCSTCAVHIIKTERMLCRIRAYSIEDSASRISASRSTIIIINACELACQKRTVGLVVLISDTFSYGPFLSTIRDTI